MALERVNPSESGAPGAGLPGNGGKNPQRNRNGDPGATVSPEPVKGPWFDVPAGTPPAECKSCHAEVYWIVTAAGKRMPVDVEVEGGRSPFKGVPGDGEQDGRGISHFATCPDRDKWRTGGRR